MIQEGFHPGEVSSQRFQITESGTAAPGLDFLEGGLIAREPALHLFKLPVVDWQEVEILAMSLRQRRALTA